ncbi:MAG: hypothetical protein HQ518_28130 [Rhodopirellula sp.]|nr:hypothetical protein [Rhodopirellula sp.]
MPEKTWRKLSRKSRYIGSIEYRTGADFDHRGIPNFAGRRLVEMHPALLKCNAPSLDENAPVSISDLGPVGETWLFSSLSFSDGKLYARTLKELICSGAPE